MFFFSNLKCKRRIEKLIIESYTFFSFRCEENGMQILQKKHQSDLWNTNSIILNPFLKL